MYSDDELIDEIDRVGGDDPPTTMQMRDEGKIGVTTYLRRFESWNDALQQAGYTPNKRHSIGAEPLLREIREMAEVRGPSVQELNDEGKSSLVAYNNHFDSCWQAVVRAGVVPETRVPLTGEQFADFFESAIDQQEPFYRLIALLAQFTGLTAEMLTLINSSWITDQAGDTLVTVPATKTDSGEEWHFRVPEVWGKNNRDTTLPGFLVWYFDHHDTISSCNQPAVPRRIVHRVAQDADIQNRRVIDTVVGETPDIRLTDLRATGGVRMARNGAPRKRIQRHLGTEYTRWQANVDDFFLWCHVHDKDFSHLDSEVDGIYLDPDTGKVREI